MPLNLTHNHFGDYTPLGHTSAEFEICEREGLRAHLLLDDELFDRPHFGLEESLLVIKRDVTGP